MFCSSFKKLVVDAHRANHLTCLKVPLRKNHGLLIDTSLLYTESCYFTRTLQFAIEGIHSLGIPWTGAFMLSGVLFRIISFPLHLSAERLIAERCHVVNTLNYEIIKKYSKHYDMNVIMNENGRFLQLDTTDKAILQKVTKTSREIISDVCRKRKLQLARIQYLKLCGVFVWTYASFAIRNVIKSPGSKFHGVLWFPDLLQPDPYYIIPLFVGAVGMLNYFVQQHKYGHSTIRMVKIINACYTLFMAVGVYCMMHLPVCIPLFWSVASFTGLVQHCAFRLPKVKKMFGIRPLPSDYGTAPLGKIFSSK